MFVKIIFPLQNGGKTDAPDEVFWRFDGRSEAGVRPWVIAEEIFSKTLIPAARALHQLPVIISSYSRIPSHDLLPFLPMFRCGKAGAQHLG